MPIPRRCARCREIKPIEQFPVKMTRRSGFGGICLACDPPEPSPIDGMSERTIRRMCRNKVRLKTEQSASETAIKHALKHKGQRVRWYHCPVCSGYHLTTKEKIDDEA